MKDQPGQKSSLWGFELTPRDVFEKGVLTKRRNVDTAFQFGDPDPENAENIENMDNEEKYDETGMLRRRSDIQSPMDSDNQPKEYQTPKSSERKRRDKSRSDDPNRSKEDGFEMSDDDSDIFEKAILQLNNQQDIEKSKNEGSGQKDGKPFSFASAITRAISTSPTKKMTLHEIYKWFSDNYPTFCSPDVNWKVFDFFYFLFYFILFFIFFFFLFFFFFFFFFSPKKKNKNKTNYYILFRIQSDIISLYILVLLKLQDKKMMLEKEVIGSFHQIQIHQLLFHKELKDQNIWKIL